MPFTVPQPMLAGLADKLPVGPQWSYEVKFDGQRRTCRTPGSHVGANASCPLEAGGRGEGGEAGDLSSMRVVIGGRGGDRNSTSPEVHCAMTVTYLGDWR